MENIFEFLKAHYQYVFIVVGLLYTLTAYFNLFGINNYSTADSGKAWKQFIFELWGKAGYRMMNMIIGILLAVCGIVFLLLN